MKIFMNVLQVLVLTGLLTAPNISAQWEKTMVDGSTSDAGKYASLKVDQNDQPHIAYRVENPDALKYTWLQGATWSYETPADAADMGMFISMDLDSMNRPGIAHQHEEDLDLAYTSRDNSTSLETELLALTTAGHFCSLNIDDDDVPHLVHFSTALEEIIYLHRPNTNWLYVPVATSIDTTTDLTICANSVNDVYVLYDQNPYLYLGHFNGTGFTPTTLIDNASIAGMDMELDSAGNPHVVFAEELSADLVYMHYNGSQWQSETAITGATSMSDSVTMTLDSSDVPHICYYSNNSALMYANRISGLWQSETIDDDGDVGQFCSMEIDKLGNVHVAYYDKTNKNLNYALQRAPTPTPTPTPGIITKLIMEDTFFTAGETFDLQRSSHNTTAAATVVDEYILLDILEMYWFWPGWTETLDYKQWNVPVGGPYSESILTFEWPVVAGGFSGIRFWGAFLTANTTDLLSYDMIEWSYGEVPPAMTLTSTAFTDGNYIPTKHTCDGLDISPDLTWSQPTQFVTSYAIIMDDPDAPGGDFVHWVLFDIPPETLSIPEDVPDDLTLPDGSKHGGNSVGAARYMGPCPPSGESHRYYFKVYALDTMTGLNPGITKDQLLDAMDGHILFQAQLMGIYQR